jgi:hypothetical protein
MKAPLSVSVVCLVVIAATATSHGQDRAAAEAAFREGRALMKAERYAEACDKLALSHRLDPAVGTLTNLGVCHEKLGMLATAWAELNEAADLAARAGDSNRAQAIRARAGTLEPRLTRLLIRIAGERPPGLKVTRDGADVTALLGTVVPVDPATYAVEAAADGAKPWTKSVEVASEGQTVTVEIPALEPIKEPVEPAPPEPEVDEVPPAPPEIDERITEEPSDPMRTRRHIALGVGIGGAVATAVGLGFGWRARSKYNESRAECNDQNLCSDQGLDLIDSAYTSANVSNVFIGVGVAAMAGAGVLWYLSRDQSGGTHVIPDAGPDRAGLSVMGRF